MKRSGTVARSMHVAAKAMFGTGLILLVFAVIAPFAVGAALGGEEPALEGHVVWTSESPAGEALAMSGERHYAVMAEMDRAAAASVDVSVQGDAVFDEFVQCANASSRVGCSAPEGWVTLGTVDLPTSCPCTVEVTGAGGEEVRVVDLSAHDIAVMEQQAGFGLAILTGCGFLAASLGALAIGLLVWAIVDDDEVAVTVPEGAVMGVAPTAPVPQAAAAPPMAAAAAQPVAVASQPIAAAGMPGNDAPFHHATHGAAVEEASAEAEASKARDAGPVDPARHYHDSLIQQGYDAATAAEHARMHYPGFEP